MTNINFFTYKALTNFCFVCKHIEKIENFSKEMGVKDWLLTCKVIAGKFTGTAKI
jgi:hypothetical protein